MNRAARSVAGLCAALMLMGLGCDGDGGTDAGVDSGEMSDTGPGGTPVDLTFYLHDPRTDTPLEGVPVAFDAPGGERTESTSGADGRVTFSAIWELGEAAITADHGGRLWSLTRLSPETLADETLDSGDIAFPMADVRLPDERVTVTGTFTNVTDPTNRFNVIAGVPGATVYNDVGPDFSVEVPVGMPFRLFGLEFTATRTDNLTVDQTFYGGQVVEVPALTEDTTIDFDLSTSLEFVESSGSVPIPDGELAGAGVYALTTSRESQVNEFLGSWYTSARDPMDDSLVNFTLRSYVVPGADTVVTRFFGGISNLSSSMVIDGLAEGSQPALPQPPRVAVPMLGTEHPLHDPFVFASVEDDMRALVGLVDGAEVPFVIWSAGNLVDGDPEVTFPRPPTGVNIMDRVVGGTGLQGRLATCQTGPDRLGCDRLGLGDQVFDLVP